MYHGVESNLCHSLRAYPATIDDVQTNQYFTHQVRTRFNRFERI